MHDKAFGARLVTEIAKELEKMPITSALRWAYASPLALLLAFFFTTYLPPTDFIVHLRNASWGLAGALLGLSLIQMLRCLRTIEIEDIAEARIFNEQVKLLASTFNFVALGLLGAALIQPLTGAPFSFSASNVFLLIGSIFVHSISQKILFAMKREPLQ